MKRQEDEGDADPSIEELCHDRPADEYFRLNTSGDCRDVVRYVHGPLDGILAVQPLLTADRKQSL